eukprot:1619226-Ditylum_brightwellii.AAC.1
MQQNPTDYTWLQATSDTNIAHLHSPTHTATNTPEHDLLDGTISVEDYLQFRDDSSHQEQAHDMLTTTWYPIKGKDLTYAPPFLFESKVGIALFSTPRQNKHKYMTNQ